MRLSKKEQVEQRRGLVLELSAKGYSEQEIGERLKIDSIKGVSQQTVSLDLKWLEDQSVEYVKRNKEEMAFEYRKVLINFRRLLKLAWSEYEKADDPNKNDKDMKLALIPIIQSLNNDIMNLRAVGDIIDAYIIKESKEEVKQTQERMDTIVGQNHKWHSTAIF